MTEKYWVKFKKQWEADPMNSNELWVQTKKDLKRREKPKHHLQLYSYCRSDNPFIRQIKNSPNITADTVAELICRQQACELQYCLSLHKIAATNRRAKIDLQGCSEQQSVMNVCLQTEKRRIAQKEEELRNFVMGLPQVQQEKPVLESKSEMKQLN